MYLPILRFIYLSMKHITTISNKFASFPSIYLPNTKSLPIFNFIYLFYEIYYKDFDFDLKFNHSLLMFKI